MLLLSIAPGLSQVAGTASSSTQARGDGLRATYFNGTNFERRIYSRIDEAIDFYYHKASPAPGLNRQHYSICWSGKLYAPVSGNYRISVRVKDGIRLWVNGVKILDKWKTQKVATYTGQMHLSAGEFYDLRIEYFNGQNEGIIQLLWELPEEESSSQPGAYSYSSRKPVPKDYLYSQHPRERAVVAQAKLTPNEPNTQAIRAAANKSSQQVSFSNSSAQVSIERMANKPSEAVEYNHLEAGTTFENLAPGEVVQLKTVAFEAKKWVLMESSFSELDKLARTMQRQKDLKIRIEAHMDSFEDAAINQNISFYRARVIATYLQDKGIDPLRIEVSKNGSTPSVAANTSVNGNSLSRGVHFVVK